jgi:phenylacetate-CoA ligase
VSGWGERAGNMLHALRRRRAADARMRWSRDQLQQWQTARLGELVRWASSRAPFYRDLYGGPIDRDVELTELPIVTKPAMMEAFDRVVTDPRLRIAELLVHLEQLRGDELYLGAYRVMTSSGSSGRKAVFVYDRAAWRDAVMTGNLRMSRMTGLAPRLPRPRVATVAAPDGRHMTYRGGASMDVGVFRARRFSAAAPLRELCAGLDAYQPTYILGYPSTMAMLAEEQLAGRLRLEPRSIITSSEVRTAPMATAIRAAWGVTPHDCLGLTELGITAVDCVRHEGMHLFEDLAIVEVVDEAGRPVPDGEPGARVLVTNLCNRTQPIIRFEVSDLLTVTRAPCACGVTFRRIVALDGRSDDVLTLPGPRGDVRVHPIHLRGALGQHSAVLQYQISQTADGLDVLVVLGAGAGPDTASDITARLTRALDARGATVAVRVRPVAAIAREAGAGKLKLVRALTPPPRA